LFVPYSSHSFCFYYPQIFLLLLSFFQLLHSFNHYAFFFILL
jgi:hypothetical protein